MPAPLDLTETGMANGALALIGEPPISSLTDPTRAAARHALRFFAETRDALLRDRHWEFARASCTPAAQPSPPNPQWNYRYVMPADCIAVMSIGDYGLPNPPGGVVPNPGTYAYTGTSDGGEPDWESPSSGDDVTIGVLLDTNDAQPFVWYTRRVVNPAQWDPLFRQLFQFALAAKLNPLVGRDKSLTAALEAKTGVALDDASARDAKQRNGDAVTRSTSWVLSRFGFTSWRG